MSRVHQAIRRAEKENRGETSVSKTQVVERGSFQAIRRESLRPMDLGAVSPVISPSDFAPARTACPVIPDSRLVALSAPKSFAGEQYRTLKTKLFQMKSVRNLRSVLVTSAAASDGKTLTAVNLALTIAQEIEQRVLLIDCDLRRPSVSKTLGLPKTDGLADFLSRDIDSSNVILTTSIANLSVVPAGSIPENPAELLNTQKMKEFFSSISQQFDWVLVDSPPVVPLADAELLSSLVDGILLVVRASKTPAESVTKAVQALKNARILGVVLNGTQVSKKQSYYYSYSSS